MDIAPRRAFKQLERREKDLLAVLDDGPWIFEYDKVQPHATLLATFEQLANDGFLHLKMRMITRRVSGGYRRVKVLAVSRSPKPAIARQSGNNHKRTSKGNRRKAA